MIIQTSDACTEGLAATQWRHRNKPRKRLHSTALRRAPGWDSLAVAVIEQAITDYFVLCNYGAVRWGKKQHGFKVPMRKRGHNYYPVANLYGIDLSDIDNIIKFLDGDVQRWADLCELDAGGWNKLMSAILRKERAGDWKRAVAMMHGDSDDGE